MLTDAYRNTAIEFGITRQSDEACTDLAEGFT
jgi:hypothetical protein